MSDFYRPAKRPGPQTGLFGPEPVTAPSVPGSETSREAARSIEPSAESLRGRVLEFLRNPEKMCPWFSGIVGVRWDRERGFTDEEIQACLDMPANTERPRRIELVAQGFVVDSGETRLTRSGRRAVVWKAKGV